MVIVQNTDTGPSASPTSKVQAMFDSLQYLTTRLEVLREALAELETGLFASHDTQYERQQLLYQIGRVETLLQLSKAQQQEVSYVR